jgi:PEGA domain
MVRSRCASRRMAIVFLLAAAGLFCGCVERRYTIRTDPPGAQVVVNGESIGLSPASHSFYYHGDREITLVKDGYETKTIIQPMNAPWWDNYATEFFTENLIPFVLRDEQEFTYKLEPARAPTQEEVEARAEALRSEAKALPPPRRGGILAWLGF